MKNIFRKVLSQFLISSLIILQQFFIFFTSFLVKLVTIRLLTYKRLKLTNYNTVRHNIVDQYLTNCREVNNTSSPNSFKQNS